MITVKFFASLRERCGRASCELQPDEPMTVAQVWQAVSEAPAPTHLLCAVNQEYAALTDGVQDGDEVAFFPPVTGG